MMVLTLIIIETVVLFIFAITPGPVPTTGIGTKGYLEHFLAYLVYSALLLKKKDSLVLALTVAVSYGIFTEVLQTFTPNRYTDVYDILFNSLGALAGVVIIKLYGRIDIFKNR